MKNSTNLYFGSLDLEESSINYKLKLFFFHVCKYLGLFWITRKSYKKNPRILCYHGFTLKDEHLFRPKLFIEKHTFDMRLKYLKDNEYNVITLEDFYKYKEERNFPDDAIVITIDDGFYSTLKVANDLLAKYKFPSTLYLTSYYCDKDCPIFMLAVQYMFYKSDGDVDLSSLNITGVSSSTNDENLKKLIDHGYKLETEQERIELLKSLAKLLVIDYEELNNDRLLNLISFDEISDLLDKGMDIQLHTHRHIFPENEEAATEEIEKNRLKIDPYLTETQTHFCYPSGVWSEKHWPVFEKTAVKTATTCEPKLIYYDTPNYSLDRILDGSNLAQIEFEAEVSGFVEFLRRIRGR